MPGFGLEFGGGASVGGQVLGQITGTIAYSTVAYSPGRPHAKLCWL